MLGWLDGLRAPAPDPGRVGWLSEWTYAHRGKHGDGIIENSTPAFAGAIEAGLGIECDVQRTRDHKALVFHDWELDRLTGDTGAVALRTLADLTSIELNEGGGAIPSLSALLAQIAGRVPLLIEVKSKRALRVNALCMAVRRDLEGYRGEHAVMSFDPRVARWFAEHSPRTVRGLVVTEEGYRGLGGALRRHLALWHAKPDFLAYDVRDFPSRFAARQRARGLPVLTWTVRSPELAAVAAEHADAPIAEGAGLA